MFDMFNWIVPFVLGVIFVQEVGQDLPKLKPVVVALIGKAIEYVKDYTK